MPTYDWRCTACGETFTAVMSMRDYCAAPPQPVCCAAPMERYFTVVPTLALHNALAGDRHYDGLRTLDGVDVSTRTKHRAYMKERGLTTADDFSGQWQRDAERRAREMSGTDPAEAKERRDDLRRAWDSLSST